METELVGPSVAKCPWCRNGCDVVAVVVSAAAAAVVVVVPPERESLSVLFFTPGHQSPRWNVFRGSRSRDELGRLADGLSRPRKAFVFFDRPPPSRHNTSPPDDNNSIIYDETRCRRNGKGDDDRPRCAQLGAERLTRKVRLFFRYCPADPLHTSRMYDFRLSLLMIVVVAVVGGGGVMVAGELSAVEKSLQFEAAFQGKLRNNKYNDNKGHKT